MFTRSFIDSLQSILYLFVRYKEIEPSKLFKGFIFIEKTEINSQVQGSIDERANITCYDVSPQIQIKSLISDHCSQERILRCKQEGRTQTPRSHVDTWNL